MLEILSDFLTPEFGYSIFRVTTPILFAALAGVISEKAGIINIGLEGLMLISALTAVIMSAFSGSAFVGLICGVALSSLSALFMAWFHLKLNTHIILAGIALNLMASGGTVFMLFTITGDRGISSSLMSKTLPNISIPLIETIPVIGKIISGHNFLTYLSYLAVIFLWFLLYKTATGLRIRVVGESPEAALSVGVNVIKVKYLAMAISGALAGFGGAYLSMGYVSWFSRDMAAGRGFIGLAAAALGSQNPFGVMLASILFGSTDALSNYMSMLRIPSEFVQMIPYVSTVVILALYARQKTMHSNRMSKAGTIGMEISDGKSSVK